MQMLFTDAKLSGATGIGRFLNNLKRRREQAPEQDSGPPPSRIVRALFGAKENLKDPEHSTLLDTLSQLPGIESIEVAEKHAHLMFIKFDCARLKRSDLIDHIKRSGLHVSCLGC